MDLSGGGSYSECISLEGLLGALLLKSLISTLSLRVSRMYVFMSWLTRKKTSQIIHGSSRHLGRNAQKVTDHRSQLRPFLLLLSRNGRKDLDWGTGLGCLIVRLVEGRETERRGREKSWFGLRTKKSFPRAVFRIFVCQLCKRPSRFPWCEEAVLLLHLPHSGNLQILPPWSFILGDHCNLHVGTYY